VHALANEPVDALCPRADRLAAALKALVDARADPEGLLDTLTAADDPALFLRGDIYGTRASTLVAIDGQGSAMIVERRFGPDGVAGGETRLSIDLKRPAE
ncbi:MAG TPA: hypothetical protein VN034_00085, partial [Sphingopyxis sp.]|nr:hypothetical protein [Sphingopyxis sp.]